MKFHKKAVTKSAVVLLAVGASSLPNAGAQIMDSSMMSKASNMVSSWPMETRKAAQMVMTKFGAPDEATASMLVWHNAGP